MLTRIVAIGNSRGIIVPRAMLDRCGFGETVDLRMQGGTLILRPAGPPRAGWAEVFAGMAGSNDDGLVHGDASGETEFDRDEWEW